MWYRVLYGGPVHSAPWQAQPLAGFAFASHYLPTATHQNSQPQKYSVAKGSFAILDNIKQDVEGRGYAPIYENSCIELCVCCISLFACCLSCIDTVVALAHPRKACDVACTWPWVNHAFDARASFVNGVRIYICLYVFTLDL